MLLVDDGEAEGAEADVIFDERVRADEDGDTAVLEAGVYLAALLGGAAARKERAPHASSFEVPAHIGVMLLRQDFRRSHDARLESVAVGNQACQHGDHGLAGTDVSLQQAVHLMAAGQVGTYFLNDAFLGAGEVKWQFPVQGIE